MQILEIRDAWRGKRSPRLRPILRDRFLVGPGISLLQSRRMYSWRNLHRFLFDVVEQTVSSSFDYLVIADSDSLFAGPGLGQILDGSWDFSSSIDAMPEWIHGQAFRQHWPLYADIARDIGLDPRPADVGTMFALFVLSRRAVDALRPLIPRLESHPAFRTFEELPGDFVFYEAFFPQLLSDLGMIGKDLRATVPGCRNRPLWVIEEYRRDLWFYHPVSRFPPDPFRRLLRRTRSA